MFRLLRAIIRPSNEMTQDYLIPSALRDPVTLTMGGVIVVKVHVNLTISPEVVGYNKTVVFCLSFVCLYCHMI